jgi:hypothetical protein
MDMDKYTALPNLEFLYAEDDRASSKHIELMNDMMAMA